MKIIPLDKKPLLWKMGFHKWGRKTFVSEAYSNVKDWKRNCQKCSAIKKGIDLR